MKRAPAYPFVDQNYPCMLCKGFGEVRYHCPEYGECGTGLCVECLRKVLAMVEVKAMYTEAEDRRPLPLIIEDLAKQNDPVIYPNQKRG